MQVIIISGRSGSGKSVALHALEDLGFYCVDNLPLKLLPSLISELDADNRKVAISIDSRNLPTEISFLKNIISQLHNPGNKCDVIYIDASDNSLLKRFSETRRKHPLTGGNISLLDAIKQERQLLTSIASLADFTLDTTELSQHELHNIIRDRAIHQQHNKLQILIQSFGFKYGLPPDADYIFDIRCLPNPYWTQGLRVLTGLDAPVIKFLDAKPEVAQMLSDIKNFANNWIPKFKQNNRSYLTFAIGCTGGKHRSVYLVEKLVKSLEDSVDNIVTRHRELVNIYNKPKDTADMVINGLDHTIKTNL